MSRPTSTLSFDDILVKYVGEFGKYQLKLLLLSSIMWVPNCLFVLLMVFHTSPNPIVEHRWKCNGIDDLECTRIFNQTNPLEEFCSLNKTQWVWTEKGKSTISQFNLVCGRAWQAQLANSIFFLGYLIGSGVFGTMADKRGRKSINFICLIIGIVGTLLTGVSPNNALYTLFRFVTGIGAAGQALTTYIIATESIGPKWRGTAGVATQLYFTSGEFLLVLVAFLFQGWRSLCFACATLSAVALLLYPLIPESPRWLLVKGRRDEAEREIRKIAQVNRAILPAGILSGDNDPELTPPETLGSKSQSDERREDAAMSLSQPEKGQGVASAGSVSGVTNASDASNKPNPAAAEEGKLTLRMILKDRHILRRFVILSYVWCVLCLVYYGISLALGGLPGSIYATFCISAAAEFVANVLAAWMIEKYGRHNTMAAGMLLGGVSCVACAICPPGGGQAILASIGKFGCSAAFTVASIYTSEMFPTLVRSAVLGAENEAARIGGMASPFVVLLGASLHKPALPFVIFGVAMLIGGFALFTLPETLGTTLPDTMKDMDGIASVFTTQPWKRGGWRQTVSEMFRSRASPKGPVATANEERSRLIGGGLPSDTPKEVLTSASSTCATSSGACQELLEGK